MKEKIISIPKEELMCELLQYIKRANWHICEWSFDQNSNYDTIKINLFKKSK